MKKTNKKGFTIVELVIVIAVIAILAAVLIPNISRLVKKANESSDLSLVRNLNTALAVENKTYATAYEAFEAVKEAGYDLTKIEAKASDNKILFDSENQCFVYLNNNKLEYYPNSQKTALTSDEYYKLWAIVTDKAEAEKSTYSVYWNGEAENITVKGVGFDAGEKTVKSVTYTGASKAHTVTIRTNGGALTVNAVKDSVNHYGAANLVDIQAVKDESYHEFGSAAVVTVTSGRFVAEKSANVLHVHAAATTAKLEEKAGANVLEYTKAFENAITVANSTKSVEKATDTTDTIKENGKKVELVAEGGVAKVNGVLFKTLQAALSVAKDGDTVTLVDNYEIPDSVADTADARIVINHKITLDFGDYKIIGAAKMSEYGTNFSALFIDADVTFVANKNGGITVNVSAEGIGPYGVNVRNGATLTVNGGTYYGGGTAIQVQEGMLEILDGNFACAPYDEPYLYKYIVNCVDKNYKNGTANIIVKGGTFDNFDPSNSYGDGDGNNQNANFVADGYEVQKTTASSGHNIYTVVKK